MIKSYDFDWGARQEWLITLMEKFPDKPMRKLQIEAMHMYPIGPLEVQRYWLSTKWAFRVCDMINKKQFPELYADPL